MDGGWGGEGVAPFPERRAQGGAGPQVSAGDFWSPTDLGLKPGSCYRVKVRCRGGWGEEAASRPGSAAVSSRQPGVRAKEQSLPSLACQAASEQLSFLFLFLFIVCRAQGKCLTERTLQSWQG